MFDPFQRAMRHLLLIALGSRQHGVDLAHNVDGPVVVPLGQIALDLHRMSRVKYSQTRTCLLLDAAHVLGKRIDLWVVGFDLL